MNTTPYIQAEPVSETLRTAFVEIARENVRLRCRDGDHEAKEASIEAQRKHQKKSEPKRFRKTIP